jgi:PAS domain S-box-containing protein
MSTTRGNLSDGINRSLAETKQALAASHEDQFRLLVDAIQDHAIFMLDTSGRVISWNLGAERLKGYRATEIIGHHFSCFYPEEDQHSGKPERLLKLAATEGWTNDEGWRVRRDGTKFWANVTITAIKDKAGSLAGFAKVTRDITELMQAAKSLRESEARYRTVVETTVDAIILIDEDSRIQFANSATTQIFGYAPAELMGHPLTMLMPERLRQGHEAAIERYQKSDQRRLDWRAVEFTGLRKNGEEFPVEVSLGEVLKEGHRLFIGLLRDIKERKSAAKKLADSEQSLRELSLHLLRMQDEERRRIGRELHDSLGQFLTALKMRLDGLSASGECSATVVAELGECSRLANESMKEVRTISYLMYPPMLEEIGLKSAIPWYLDGFSQRSGIETRFEVSADFNRLPLDAELAMFRVLQESLTNVHRHSGSFDASVKLGVREGMAVLEISDTGKGLPAGSVEPGAQEGTGSFSVGLRGMSERMQQLGGILELSSNQTGTTVTARIPFQVPEIVAFDA